MIAANGAMSRFMSSRGYASVQIVALAKTHGLPLSSIPTSTSLRAFLSAVRVKLSADIDLFRDLCLAVIKLLGRGEYIATEPNAEPVGHFALAVSEYSHSTAPNRRFPDVIVHRILKAAMKSKPSPYTKEQLDSLAEHCTEREGAATKIERMLRKSAACIVLTPHVGKRFPAFITGAGESGTYARFTLEGVPAEGRVVGGDERTLKVGKRIQAELVHLDIDRGHIDISEVGEQKAAAAEAEDDE
jgi:exoribonuclease R